LTLKAAEGDHLKKVGGMEYTVIVIMVALVQYLFFGLRTGVARPKYNVMPPKTTGDETWERIYRVHQNTMEQLVTFIPAILGFTYYVSSTWAVVLGVCFIVARQYYSMMYIKHPPTRRFPPSFFVNVILVVGTLIGIILQLVKVKPS
jgi:glutathione S-transferase